MELENLAKLYAIFGNKEVLISVGGKVYTIDRWVASPSDAEKIVLIAKE